MREKDVNLVLKPTEFFREKISNVLEKQQIKVSEEIEFYLVNLLCEFISPAPLQTKTGTLDLLDTPLALVLKEAVEASSQEQIKIYKILGDTSLYVSGYFQDYFNRKTIDIDYYMLMGSTAYNHLSALDRERNSELYSNLSLNFHVFVEVVAEVADQLGGINKSKNLLAIYDRWTRNNSDRLRKTLEEYGITPIANTNTKIIQ